MCEARTLAEAGYDIDLVALEGEGLPVEEVWNGVRVHRWLTSDFFDIKRPWHRRQVAARIAAELPVKVVHAHDLHMLHLACLIRKCNPGTRIIYDSHELFHGYPLNLTRQGNLLLWLKSWLIQKYTVFRERMEGSTVDALITVNDSLANVLQKHFRLPDRPLVLKNLPRRQQRQACPESPRQVFGLSDDTKILIYAASNIHVKTKNIEQPIMELGNCEGVALVFVAPPGKGREATQELVKRNGFTNVYFQDWVPMEQLADFLLHADAGVLPTWNKSASSYWLASDCKLFDYVQAQLPILTTRQPEYVTFVEGNGFGVCVNPEVEGAFKRGFFELLDRRQEFEEPLRLGSKSLVWEEQAPVLVSFYDQFMAGQA